MIPLPGPGTSPSAPTQPVLCATIVHRGLECPVTARPSPFRGCLGRLKLQVYQRFLASVKNSLGTAGGPRRRRREMLRYGPEMAVDTQPTRRRGGARRTAPARRDGEDDARSTGATT